MRAVTPPPTGEWIAAIVDWTPEGRAIRTEGADPLPGRRGVKAGAITWQRTSSARICRYKSYPDTPAS
jgi:hypothetical protein